jgi:hypothetical protein
VGHLHVHGQLRSGPQDGAARHIPGEVGGPGGVDHVGAVILVGHAQGQAQRGVGPDGVRDHSCRPLGREQQVHPQAAAPLGEVHDAVDEVGKFPGQGRELVDHHHERRRAAGDGELQQIGHATESHDPFAVAELRPQGDQGAFGQVR